MLKDKGSGWHKESKRHSEAAIKGHRGKFSINPHSPNDQIIKTYAEHFHSPIGDFKNFNKELYEQTGLRTTKSKVAHLLGYTTKR